ncbi:MAG: S-formylglutathione hydrolase [Deltaproteobacteria bacterium]|nr:S-formylglutathione hydrolase [Deltaproteobacteria bacterium]
MTTAITTRSAQRCFGGTQGFYAHASVSTGTEMRFAVYVPPHAAGAKLPALYYLAGLTCTEETFAIKAGAQRLAAELGLVLVTLDTSPRGLDLPGDSASWDFGVGAGFYVDATEAPWARNYRMYSYVVDELPAVIEANFPVSPERRGITGHSMGGHGALVIALRNPGRYRAVSAFAPIANPMAVPWGEKAFGGYLGADRAGWEAYDASVLMARTAFPGEILVDQGEADQFLATQLRPDALERAAAVSGQKLRLRRHDGYDHSYWFIETFVGDHLAWHAERLR